MQTTTTSTGVKPAGDGEKVTMDMNVGGMTMGVNVNISGMDNMEMEENTTVTTTTKTTTSGNVTSTTTAAPRKEVVVTNAVSGCSKSMSDSAFESARKNIADKGFDETRLSTAKSIIKSNCMTSAQIKQVCDSFGFEETKLDFAKYAHDYCYDQGNYYVVNETFAFSDSTEALNSYIDSK